MNKNDKSMLIKRAQDRNTAYADMVKNNDKDRLDTLNLYNYFKKHKNEPYKEFIKSIGEELNKEIDKDYLLRKLGYIKKHQSQRKADEMLDILKLSIYIAKNDQENIKIMQDKLDKIDEINNSISKIAGKPFHERVKEKNIDSHEKTIRRLKRAMNMVIRGTEFTKKKTLKNNKDIKLNFKEFDKDLYIDYVIKVFKLEPLKEEELDHLIETIDFFINNIRKKLDYLRSLDPKINEKEVKELYVDGEEELTNEFKKKKKSLRTWKITELVNQYDFYIKYKAILDAIKKEHNFSIIKSFTDKEKLTMKKEYDFILSTYNQIIDIQNRKETYIDSLVTLKPNKDEYEKKYINKMILK